MKTIEIDLLCWTRDLCNKLLENGQFFTTAIEFNPDDFSIDGEDLRHEMERLLQCITDYQNSIDLRSIKARRAKNKL